MAKRSHPTEPLPPEGTPPRKGAKARKRQERLQRELADLGRKEARRIDQLEKVRAEAADVRRRLAALAEPAVEGDPPNPAGSAPDPTGYCMREKRRVRISDPAAVTLSNGRNAIAGTCSTCGAKVVALTARAAPPAM